MENIMTNYNKLLNNLETLKLDKIRNSLPISIIDSMYELTQQEISFRDERASKVQITVAAFPFEKEIKDFDFSYQSSINRNIRF